MRCAYGVPAHMIHVPVFFGVVENPVDLASYGHMIMKCGGDSMKCSVVVACGSVALMSLPPWSI